MAINQNDSSRDMTASQLGQEDGIVSGRQSVLSTAKTLHQVHSASQQFDDTVPTSDRRKQSAAETGPHATNSTTPARFSTQRPPSAAGQRPPTASGRRRSSAVRSNVTDSYIDESLFGPVTDDTFAASRQPRQRPVKPFIFDCTDYKAKVANANSSTRLPSSRPASSRRSRPQSARLDSRPSFVDESLFGKQLEMSTWRAPWDKKDCRPKPFTFDTTDYRKKQQRDSQLQRASSANKGSTRQPAPWR